VDQMTAPSRKHPLTAPLDVSKITNEKGVKALVKRLLDLHGWFFWMPPANGFGTLGVHDFSALKNSVFLTIETKFGTNKPTPMQKSFAAQIIANEAFAFCVNERNIDHLAMWLESFEIATRAQMARQEVPAEHGARMVNAMSVLTDGFA
jgi:hypothetical protein